MLPSKTTLPLRIEALAFADAAFLWAPDPLRAREELSHRVRSFGAGVRINAMGMLMEFHAVKPLDRLQNGWTFGMAARPGF